MSLEKKKLSGTTRMATTQFPKLKLRVWGDHHLNKIVCRGVRQLLQHNEVDVGRQVAKLGKRLHLQRTHNFSYMSSNKRHAHAVVKLTSADSSTEATL